MRRTAYADRVEAGRELGARLSRYRDAPGLIVLGLPRGGVPVAAEVAAALDAPLDVLVARKIGLPWQSELAMGAIAAVAGEIVTVTNPHVLRTLADATRGPAEAFERVAERERIELERRQREYRGDRQPLSLGGATVILVDDGVATGATMRAALTAIRGLEPAAVVVAVPVGAKDSLRELAHLADQVECLWTPEPFWAVGQAYVHFGQTTDAEVKRLLGAPGS
jgi:putative phosphoribosyl transferase